MKLRTGRHLFAALVIVLATSSCSSSTSGDQGSDENSVLTEGMRGADSNQDPVSGGTLRYAGFAEPRSLDPAVTLASSNSGGVELVNIYDTLLRYDSAEKTFVPQLAQELDAEEDYRTWTLTLRDGVSFSNGTALDAAAVKWSQDRYAALPAPEAALWKENVESVTAEDADTVVYRLTKPWPNFPSILSTGPGMIVAADSVGKDATEFTPIGAGPFTLQKWSPTETMVLEARADYWDGTPYLDTVEIAYLNDPNAALDSLKSQELDAGLFRDPDKISEIVDLDLPGNVQMVAAANVALINAAPGKPGADPRVRRAMALAVDPDLIRKRAFNGFGLASSALFDDYSLWRTETRGLPHDVEEAKRLVDEAKADGFDGKVTFLDNSRPERRAEALAFKASLEAVGFEVTLDLVQTIGDQITKIMTQQTYDVAAWGMSFREADPFAKLYAAMHSSGNQTYNTYTSPAMDALVDEFQGAAEHSDQVAIMDRIQTQLNQDVPFLVWSAFTEYTAWNKNVHGVIGTSNSMFLASKIWID